MDFSPEERLELRQLYKFIFRGGKNLRAALAEAKGKFHRPASKTLLEFIATAKRGVCSDTGQRDHEEN